MCIHTYRRICLSEFDPLYNDYTIYEYKTYSQRYSYQNQFVAPALLGC